MKKTILIFILTGFIISGTAQILPTMDFESWEGGVPTGWFSSNILNIYVPVTQSADAHSGSYSVKGTIVAGLDGNGYPPLIAAGLDSKGFPINSRVGALQGWYKFNSDSGDAFFITVVVLKNNKAVGSGGFFSTQNLSEYTKFEANIQYNSSDIPDTMQILALISNSTTGVLHPGSTFYMDDLSLGTATGVKDQIAAPFIYNLKQNYPNPFNPNTKINYTLAEPGLVKLKVYNVLGEVVKTLVNENLNAGEHFVEFDASGLPSGVYIYKIEAGNFVDMKKLMLLK